MKRQRTIHAALAATLALALLVTALPVSLAAKVFSVPKPAWTVPEGYNEHDYNKCAAFLEQTDENGEKNGEKLARQTIFMQYEYDVNDPSTWGKDIRIESGEIVYVCPFEWVSVGGEMRMSYIDVNMKDLVGYADFADCTELTLFNCSNDHLTGLDLSGCTALEIIYTAYNELAELNVTGCTALSELWCYENPLRELDLSDCSALTKLYCGDAGLTSLDVSNASHLQELKCNRNELIELDITGCNELEIVECIGNAITSLDLSYRSSLRWLACFNNELTTLDLSGCIALENVFCYNNSISGCLNLSGCSELDELQCYSNCIEELNLSGCIELRTLECSMNYISEIDVSDCPALETLGCLDNLLTEIDLTHNARMQLEMIRAEGGGTVGCSFGHSPLFGERVWLLSAKANLDHTFLGWYDENGEFFIYDPNIDVSNYYGTVLIAHFTAGGTLPGDVDGDGGATVQDAIITLRASMGLIELSPDQFAAGDMNGDGSITVQDAILVLRAALGLMQ